MKRLLIELFLSFDTLTFFHKFGIFNCVPSRLPLKRKQRYAECQHWLNGGSPGFFPVFPWWNSISPPSLQSNQRIFLLSDQELTGSVVTAVDVLLSQVPQNRAIWSWCLCQYKKVRPQITPITLKGNPQKILSLYWCCVLLT